MLVKDLIITSNISSMQLNLPTSPASSMYVLNVYKENLAKFRKFTETILNPATISELILKFGHLSANQVDQENYI